jgi:hypothetical protein
MAGELLDKQLDSVLEVPDADQLPDKIPSPKADAESLAESC